MIDCRRSDKHHDRPPIVNGAELQHHLCGEPRQDRRVWITRSAPTNERQVLFVDLLLQYVSVRLKMMQKHSAITYFYVGNLISFSIFLHFNQDLCIFSMLWIRIRSDPKLFAESGSVIINFGSGSDNLQFFVTKNLLRMVIDLFTIRTKKITSRLDKSLL